MTRKTNTTSGAPIRLSNISKSYGDTVILDDLSLDIRGGEFLTLLGASGSGKSTLLNIIAGFVKPTGGTVEVDGATMNKVPPHKRGFGMVFQNYSLFPHMTIAENVAFPLKRRGWSKERIAAGVAEALDVVQLGHLGARKPSELSGGQQQRVALARAIVFRPPVLLMDEPLGALDKLLREQLQLEVRRLHQELGITFIFVTHDQDEALAMSDRIALLRNGSIVQVGSPEELYKSPNSRYAAEFIGASNIFAGRAVGADFADKDTGQCFRLPGSGHRGDVSVLLRPERLQVCAHTEPIPVGCDSVTGVVEDSVYFGSSRQVLVRTKADRVVIARTPVPLSHDAVTPGARVSVYWNVGDVTILSDPIDSSTAVSA
ncbi:ABC transporter ATP-binding protein [Rhodococcus sp. ABRD24]|uniref:ABC transporter ATP-binding protein n=1 Tax=Rhodococcus sp. ABRD24 TaxID=2507582 RepID=UPI00103F4DA7|nr:ABC transporter ATP-binding protein [Rhodococcus sp. ABRD24]QBJ96299.1 ABC transporter ATP-binding protein [Rhodococcus sp. ABRD24]